MFSNRNSLVVKRKKKLKNQTFTRSFVFYCFYGLGNIVVDAITSHGYGSSLRTTLKFLNEQAKNTALLLATIINKLQASYTTKLFKYKKQGLLNNTIFVPHHFKANRERTIYLNFKEPYSAL